MDIWTTFLTSLNFCITEIHRQFITQIKENSLDEDQKQEIHLAYNVRLNEAESRYQEKRR